MNYHKMYNDCILCIYYVIMYNKHNERIIRKERKQKTEDQKHHNTIIQCLVLKVFLFGQNFC